MKPACHICKHIHELNIAPKHSALASWSCVLELFSLMYYNHEKERWHIASDSGCTAAIMQNDPSWWGSSTGIQLGEKFLLGSIQCLLMHWQYPAAPTAVGICCKLVKPVCLQTTLIQTRVPARHSNNHRWRECKTSLIPPFQPKSSDALRAFQPWQKLLNQKLNFQGNVHTVVSLCLGWVSGKQRQGMRNGKRNRKITERTVLNAMFCGKHMLLPLQRCWGSSCSIAAGDTGDTYHPQSFPSGCSLELNSICDGLNDSTLPPGALAGLHTSALLLSQSSDVMHYLAWRCF